MVVNAVPSSWYLRRWSFKTSLLLLSMSLSTAIAQARPVISSFSPGSGAPGTSVAILGSGFSGTLSVQFGLSLAVFSVSSDGVILTTVPLDATTGPITVTTSSGPGVSPQQFVVAPRITDFSPTNGPPGALVLVNGANFDSASTVQFNGTNAASFSVTSSSQLQAIVPVGATTGPISITTPAGMALSSTNFLVTGNQPFISSFSPTNAAPGTTVVIDGFNFTGATAVKFNGTNAPSFSVTAPTQIHVTVPPLASTGPISVTTALGTGASATPFVVSTAPVITDFFPLGGAAGTVVVINGLNLTNATAVKFAGVSSPKFSVNAPTQIQATVPAGAGPGPITITTAQGNGTSTSTFYAGLAPLILDFFPTAGLPGSSVVLDGLNFTNVLSVSFGGVKAHFGVPSPTQITATVPAGASNGPITIVTAAGTNTTLQSFLVRTGKPIILDFNPSAGLPATTITIDGLDLTGASSVQFNGAPASFLVVADTQISALVPNSATTGPISITTPTGTTSSAMDFIVAPRIASFSPTNGVAGTVVTIRGTNFTHLSQVEIGGVPTPAMSVTAGQIVATVPPAAVTGSISVTTPGGIVATPNFFLVQPAINQFSPLSGPPGTSVTIQGTGFSGVGAVSFAGTAASFNVLSATQIVAIVPPRAISGPITVSTTSGSATSAQAFTVGAASDLAILQTQSASTVLQDQVLTYSIVVTNQGPSTATGVSISDLLPVNAVLLSASITPGSYGRTAQGLTAQVLSLTNSATATLTVSVLPLTVGLLTNVVTVSANEADLNLANNTNLITTTVQVNPAVVQIVRLPSNQLQLSWPVARTNFTLHTTVTLPSEAWNPVSGHPTVFGNQNVLSVNPSLPAQFFRLMLPP